LILFEGNALSNFQRTLPFVKPPPIVLASVFFIECAESASIAADGHLDDDTLAAQVTVFPNPSQEPP
jgi:hypothetical protein